MIQMQECIVPKILGQVMSALHFVLATKIVRMAIQGGGRDTVTAKDSI